MQRDLASTLEAIANRGPAGFYEGETARLISEAVRAAGGIMTREDLGTYRAVERPVVRGSEAARFSMGGGAKAGRGDGAG